VFARQRALREFDWGAAAEGGARWSEGAVQEADARHRRYLVRSTRHA
jgi:hypothetical protein